MTVRAQKSIRELSYTISFRIPAHQVEEVDASFPRERLRRRADFLASLWEFAWAEYKRAGSLEALAKAAPRRRYSRRVSEEMQDQLHAALDLIFERAPSAVVEQIAKLLTERAGKYGDERK